MTTTTSTESDAAFDLTLTESQELVRRTARDFATEKLLPIAHDIDEQGKVPAAIHVSPEALPDGPLARVRDGDLIRLDARSGTLEAVGVDLAMRAPANSPPPPTGTGRELFALMRLHVSEAEAGASAMLAAMDAEIR